MGSFSGDTGGYEPGGDSDFTPGSVMQSDQVDTNFTKLQSHLDSAFVDDAVTAIGALNGDRITDNTITFLQIAPDTITNAEIAANAVGASELADNAVDTAAIVDLNVTDAKIADLDGAKLQAGTVPAASLGPDIIFPYNVVGETIQFPALGASIPVSASSVNPVGISVYPVGMPGSPYTEGVHYNFVAPNLIQQIDNGPAPGDIPILTNIEIDYNASTFVAPGSVTNAGLADNAVTNIKVDGAAAIELSKLDDFDGGVKAVVPGGSLTGTLGVPGIALNAVTATQIAPNAVGVSEIAPNAVGASEIINNSVGMDEIAPKPIGRIYRAGTGAALVAPGTWQNVLYPAGSASNGMSIYNDGTNDAGFIVPRSGWYNVTGSAEFTGPSSVSATAVGVRIVVGPGTGGGTVIAKDIQGWTGSALNPGAGCSQNVYLAGGSVVRTQFNATGDNPVPDIESSMSIAWVSD